MEFYFKMCYPSARLHFFLYVLQYDIPVPIISFVNTVPTERFRLSAMLFLPECRKLKDTAMRSSQKPQLSNHVQ